MRRSALHVAGVIAVVAASTSCGGKGCPFAMLRTILLGGTNASTTNTVRIFDVDLTAKDIEEVNLDSTLIPSQPGQVDAFLTTADCSQLFAGPYTGTVASPLCTIYLGPIGPGGVSERREVPSGRYRVIGQPWTTNTGPVRFGFDIVVWGANCSATPAAPGSGF
jgi:hypothetical protein